MLSIKRNQASKEAQVRQYLNWTLYQLPPPQNTIFISYFILASHISTQISSLSINLANLISPIFSETLILFDPNIKQPQFIPFHPKKTNKTTSFYAYDRFITRVLSLLIKKQQVMSKWFNVQGIPVVQAGLNYLVPSSWWQQFCSLNKSKNKQEELIIPELKLTLFAESFLADFQDHIAEELEAKCNYLRFSQVKINLEVRKDYEWTAISPDLWKIINFTPKFKHGILTYLPQEGTIDVKRTKQVQIIFCSKMRSDAFVGYLPEEANLMALVREVGFDMGYVQVTKSKINFVERSQKSYTFHELEKYSLKDAPDNILMAFNMQRKNEEEEHHRVVADYANNTTINESNEAVVGDLNTMEDDSNNHMNQAIHNRTISTGAETPYSFALSNGFDLDREYRVNELFGSKQPEEIEEMKNRADVKISNEKDFIPIPHGEQQDFQVYLDKLAQDLLQGLSKKRTHKQKQMDLQYQ